MPIKCRKRRWVYEHDPDDPPPVPYEPGDGWYVAHHAAERWIERVCPCADTHVARNHILHALDMSFQIPNRHAVTLWINKVTEAGTASSRREGVRWYMAGYAVFIVSGNRVVTVLRASDSDVHTVLAWLLTGIWGDSR